MVYLELFDFFGRLAWGLFRVDLIYILIYIYSVLFGCYLSFRIKKQKTVEKQNTGGAAEQKNKKKLRSRAVEKQESKEA